MEQQEKPTFSTVMVALSMFGATMSTNPTEKGTAIANLITGVNDKYMHVLAFHQENGELPETFEQAATDPKAMQKVENMKNFWRNIMQDVFSEAARQEERRMRAEHEAQTAKVNAAFKNMNKPAPEGTVKELAAKYGKSLSEIRRLKAENRLHELAEQSA